MAGCEESSKKKTPYDTAGLVKLDNEHQAKSWYKEADQYWKGIPATVDGVMGGLANLSTGDVLASKKFLQDIKSELGVLEMGYALDCGAGIGRVSKRLLLPLFDKVDLVELNPAFLDRAKTYLGQGVSRVGAFHLSGLQEFVPEKDKYDVVWCQWVLSHLTDKDLIQFLIRSVAGLRGGGVIVVKENVAEGASVHDAVDSSVSRTRQEFMNIFSEAGLTLLLEQCQENFPQELFDVYMFALKPTGKACRN